jgi:hypothetical protein
VTSAKFANDHGYLLTGILPSGLIVSDITLQAFAMGYAGEIRVSNPEAISLHP